VFVFVVVVVERQQAKRPYIQIYKYIVVKKEYEYISTAGLPFGYAHFYGPVALINATANHRGSQATAQQYQQQ